MGSELLTLMFTDGKLDDVFGSRRVGSRVARLEIRPVHNDLDEVLASKHLMRLGVVGGGDAVQNNVFENGVVKVVHKTATPNALKLGELNRASVLKFQTVFIFHSIFLVSWLSHY